MKRFLSLLLCIMLTIALPLDASASEYEWPVRDNGYAFPFGYSLGQTRSIPENGLKQSIDGCEIGGVSVQSLHLYGNDEGLVDHISYFFQPPSGEAEAQKQFDRVEKELEKLYGYCTQPDGNGPTRRWLVPLMVLAALSEEQVKDSHFIERYNRYVDAERSLSIEHLVYIWGGKWEHYISYQPIQMDKWLSSAPTSTPVPVSTPVPALPEATAAPAPQFAPDGQPLTVGSHFFFGHYEQDNILSNGRDPIEWIVLKAGEDRVMAITRYALKGMRYSG